MRNPLRTVAVAAAAVMAVAGQAGPAMALDPVHILPPKRPASLGTLDVATTGSLAASAGAMGAAVRPASLVLAQAAAPAGGRPAPLYEAAIVERANGALNAVRTFSADFQQVASDGRPLQGTLYVQRPGKLRFDYDKPATLEVVSDGSTVLVRDRKLQTNDPYPISQTPLKFLTSARIDLAGEAKVIGTGTDADGYRVTLEDSSTIGGTSKITLFFDPEFKQLKRWRVIDPQGFTTTVSLSDIEMNRTIDPKVFMLNYSRPQE